MDQQLASILVGDHLGQVKKVLWPSCEVSVISGLSEPDQKNPVVSIEPIESEQNQHLICTRNGDSYIYDSIRGKAKKCKGTTQGPLIKSLPFDKHNIVHIYDKRLLFEYSDRADKVVEVKLKKGQIKNARVHDGRLAIVGKDIPLRVFDTKTRNKIYEADPPEKDWLGIRPECDVAGLQFVGPSRVVTCSKSDSVIRVYDIDSKKTLPIIKVELNQTASNEYAEAGRFLSVASSTSGLSANKQTIVIGSNVGQLIAIDLRFGWKQQPKKKLQAKNFKILGGFKGSRGGTYVDIKVVAAHGAQLNEEYKVISCCLDRYIRIHNLSKLSGRHLERDVYMKTKPMCCSPVFYLRSEHKDAS